jgi:hypothetical protein
LVGPVGFEPTTSAESIVYGYPHALPNLLIPPKTGHRLTRPFILEPVFAVRSLTRPHCHSWLDYGPSKRFEAKAPPARAGKFSV